MNRTWILWSAFALCVAVVFGAMGWTTLTVLRLEDNSRRQAVREENVRLALWRMDSSVAPLLAQEAAMPYFAYGAFYPAQRPFSEMFAANSSEMVLPSPLLTRGVQHAKLYFQFDPSGELSSPQVPTKGKMDLAKAACATPEKVNEAAERMMHLQALVTREQLLERLPAEAEPEKTAVTFANPTVVGGNWSGNTGNATVTGNNSVPGQVVAYNNTRMAPNAQSQATQNIQQSLKPTDKDANDSKNDQVQQQAEAVQMKQQREDGNEAPQQQRAQAARGNWSKGLQEFEVRKQVNKEAQSYAQISSNTIANNAAVQNGVQMPLMNGTLLDNTQLNCVLLNSGAKFDNGQGNDVSQGVMMPVWVGNSLLLARRVTVGGKMYVQGCWMNWDWLRERLLSDVRDLLPDAALEPAAGVESERAANRLAALPVKLNPGESIPLDAPEGLTPVRVSLSIAWVCALLAAGAVATLLFGAVRLSERRGAFVSAVTHELRTPLTTFQMYAEMLAGGMVPTKEGQQNYLNTLSAEAGRLSHLVENVLSYARLERGSARSQVERVSAQRLIEKIRPRLAERAHQAGMQLTVDLPETMSSTELTTDVTAVEQILFNLVDNACKYAAHGADKTIALSAGNGDGKLAVRVCDGGPGFSHQELRKLFRPFSKSARQAAHSAPGVGLGLALSKRLARDLRGDLKLLSDVAKGACFELTLPLEKA